MTNNPFAGRIFAAVFALLLSTTMLISAVGPAVNVQGAGIAAQGMIA